MDVTALRDHASLILDIVIADLETAQTPDQQSEKSMGRGPRGAEETYAETHASARLESGYTIIQLVSEYRALRTSVLMLWAVSAKAGLLSDPDIGCFDYETINSEADGNKISLKRAYGSPPQPLALDLFQPLNYFPYETLIATAPAITTKTEKYRIGVMRSRRKMAAMATANTTEVSRRAATRAIGALVMAQSAKA